MSASMPSSHTFISPREIIWGRGSVQYLEKLKGKKAFIVTDKVLSKIGSVAKVADQLAKAGIGAEVFDEVEPEFITTTVEKMVEKHRSYGPDIIIGLGGGSPMDAAKAFRIFYEYPDLSFADLLPLAGRPKKPVPSFTKTRYITIPTSSGTGSEVTPVFVVTNPANNDKHAVFSYNLVADVAILDPDFTDSMPRGLQVDSGFDALSHAIPSYISNFSNDLSKSCAIQSVILIMKYLEKAADGDKEAKEHMHYAACLAGKAFTNSGLGLEHHLGHFIGSKFHIPHGRACAITLPHVIKFNSAAAASGIAELAKTIGYTESKEIDAASYLIDRINSLMKKLGVAFNLKSHGISEKACLAEASAFIEDYTKAPAVPPIMSNPQKCTVENMKALYNQVCFEQA